MRKPRPSSHLLINRRGLLLLGIQGAVIGGLGWRMHQLQIDRAEEFHLLAEENRINIRLIAPERGLILDRNGKILAENQQNYRITITAEQAGDAREVLQNLARLIPLSPARQAAVLVEIEKRSAFVAVTVVENLSWEEFSRVASNAPALPGISPDVGLTRNYPNGAAVAHVTGYVGPVSERDLEGLTDPDPVLKIPRFQIGKTGVEQRIEDDLRGSAGHARIEVNAVGRVMRELSRVDGAPGRDVHLTIDRALQEYASERLGQESAAAVVMDITSGDVLASVSAPSFDPNSFVFGISLNEWNGLRNDDHRPMSNKPVSGEYPPGSTFKMVVALAALEAGVINPNETLWCPGYYQLGNRRFHCWARGGHGQVNMETSLKRSCDVYYYEVARRTGVTAIGAMARRLGLGQDFELPLPAVFGGLIPTAEWKQRRYDDGWRPGDTLNMGIGQGFVLTTPLQLAVMTARIASGKEVQPRLIRAVDGSPVPLAEPVSLGLSEVALGHVQRGMMEVVNDTRGTAYGSRIADPENRMAGKTGTSQVRNITAAERAGGVTRNQDLPWERRDHALFVCYAPFNKPRYAITVVVEHGGGGSAVAAPIARDIMMRALYGDTPPLIAYPPGEREQIQRQRAAAPQAPGGTGPRGRA